MAGNAKILFSTVPPASTYSMTVRINNGLESSKYVYLYVA